jgi:anti-repressor protein
MQSTKNLPVIAGVEINVDSNGLYNLNALHRASGAGDSKKPSEWARNEQVQELIAELHMELSGNSRLGQKVINIQKGGANPGTFTHELLAVSYAGWISPSFQLKVNQAFLDSKDQKQSKIPHDYKSAVQHLLVQIEENERLGIQVQTQKHYMQEAADELEHCVPYKELADAHGAISLADAVKTLGLERNKTYQVLREIGVLQKGKTIPYQKYVDSGHFIVRTSTHGNNIIASTHVTSKGLEFLYKKLEEAKRVHRSMDIEMLLRNLRADVSDV